MNSINISDLLRLKKQLLPNGRAFRCATGSEFEKLFLSFCDSEKRVIDDGLNTLNVLIPDNTGFVEVDCEYWERVFGLVINPLDTLAARKARILTLMSFPNNQLSRQHWLFIQKQLQDAGFPVYIHEFINIESSFDYVQHDTATEHGDLTIEHGAYSDVPYESIISDFIDKSREPVGGFTLAELRSTFFIGGATFPNYANIPATQEKSFRQLILRLKPLHTVGFVQVNYI